MTDQNEPLSEREVEILRLVATGASNKEIATSLAISPNTVKVHLRNIFTKINVVSRTEATLYAIKNGVVEQPGMVLPVGLAYDLNTPINDNPLDLVIERPDGAAPAIPERMQPVWPTWLMAGLLVLLALSAGAWLLFNPAALRPSTINNTPLPTTAPRWMADSGLPDKRSAMGVAVYDNNIFLIGGESEAGVDGTLRIFNPVAHNWKNAAAKPTAVSDCQAAVIGEKIYVPGGLLKDGQPSDALEVYNPRLNTWEKKASLPMPLSGYALVAQEGSLYLFGGWDGKKVSGSVFKYDPSEDRWSERRGLSSPRTGASAVALEGKILVIGGSDGKTALKLVQAYIPDRDVDGDNPWQDLPSLPEGRYGMAAVNMASIVYLLGGQTTPGVTGGLQPLMLQQGASSWQVFDAGGPQLGFDARAAAYGNFIHLFGGKNGSTLSSTHLTYQALYTVAIPLISGSDR